MRKASVRVAKYVAGLDPMEIYLRIKKLRHSADLIIGVQTLKDIAVNNILADYELDARLNVLALMAWRELYYMFYKTKQQVTISEP